MGRTMILYHGINIANIKILEPKQADHDRPCVYMTTFEIVSSFYLCNAVERPYYLFPYGFTKENIPIYHELYPNALKEVSDGVAGYIYKVEADESQVIPFKNIPTARLATEPIEVADVKFIDNAYDYFLQNESKGLLKIGRFEDKSIPTASQPKLLAATIVEPMPLKGSRTLHFFLAKVLINFSQRQTG